MLLANLGGVGLEKSALDLAFLIPDMLNHVVSTGFLSIVFIPLFTEYLLKKDSEAAWGYFSRILNALVVLILLLGIPAWIWMGELLQLLSSRQISPELLARATHFGRIILPAQLFFLIGTFLIAVQHTRKQFLLPSLTGVLYNLFIIIGGWLGRHQGLDGFAWGVPVGSALAFVALQLFGTLRGGLHWRPHLNFRNPEILLYLRRMLPLVLGVGAMFSLELVIRALGPRFGPDAIAALSYAWRIMYTLVAVFGFSVGVASYPEMSRLAASGNLQTLQQQLSLSLSRMFALLIPAIFAVWLLAHPLVKLLLERGAFSPDHTAAVTSLLRGYLLTALGLCAQAVLVRAFYARGQMWTPSLINTSVFLVSLPFYSMLAPVFGILSIPYISVISASLQTILLWWVWVRRLPNISGTPRLFLPSLVLLIGVLPLVLWVQRSPFWINWTENWTLVEIVFYGSILGITIIVISLFLQKCLGSEGAIAVIRTLKKRLSL